jgi:hypothetical protein
MISAGPKSQTIALTAVQTPDARSAPPWDTLAQAALFPGIHAEIVTQGRYQIRSILRLQPAAIVIWVGRAALQDAAQIITQLRDRAPPPVVAIPQRHEASTEYTLRRAGAIYLCGGDVPATLRDLLVAIIHPDRLSPAWLSPNRRKLEPQTKERNAKDLVNQFGVETPQSPRSTKLSNPTLEES